MVAYVTVDGNPVLSGSRMTIIAGDIFCTVQSSVICFATTWSRERVPVPANNQKLDLVALGKESDHKPGAARNYCGSTASASGNAGNAGDGSICIPELCIRSARSTVCSCGIVEQRSGASQSVRRWQVSWQPNSERKSSRLQFPVSSVRSSYVVCV